jgi:glycosyltransferase involved in cell wall biosynthesis
MRVLLVSPYHGGSHAAWALGLRRHSRHEIELLTLPDRFWKWRMHGGAVTLARRWLRDGTAVDAILATDMLDLTTFLALTRPASGGVPAVLYMHENQLTYPLPADGETGPMRRQGGERDHHYAFVNFASMLAAERVVFNSEFHRDTWFEALPRFLRHFPEHNELGAIEALRARSSVLPVGIEAGALRRTEPTAARVSAPGPHSAGKSQPSQLGPTRAPEQEDLRSTAAASRDSADAGSGTAGAPLVLWNQRWEYDKNPAQLLRALRDVADRGIAFRLAICGRPYGESPPELATIRETFADRLAHFGFADDDEYRRLLGEAAIVVSTAVHEFFGIAVLEAMAAGAFAVLPNRLSYPELLDGPEVSDETRRSCLYDSHDGLVDRLVRGLQSPEETAQMRAELARSARRFDWRRVAPAYDELLDRLRLETTDSVSSR